MFFHSNAVLVYQTSKRKRVIAEPEGVQTKSLKKVVVPEKSDSTPLILATESTPQNLGYRNYAALLLLVPVVLYRYTYIHTWLIM